MAAYSRVKSFGLGQHRLALPENDPSRLVMPPPSKKQKKKRRSIGEKVSNFLHRSGGTATKSIPPSQSPLLQAKKQGLIQNYASGEVGRKSPAISNGRRTPNHGSTPGHSPALHLRVLGSHSLSGSQSSLDNILQNDYGFKRDGTPVMNRKKLPTSESNLIKLTLLSNGKGSEHNVTLKKNKAGLGIHLSIGPPPVSVTLVEPRSVAMTAGVKEGDIIVQVNGKDCRSMEALQLSELLELKSLIQHAPSDASMESARKLFKAGGNVDSESSSSDESDSEREDDEREINLNNKKKQKHIRKGVWNRIKAEGLIDSGSESGGSFVNLPITAIESSSSDEEEWLAGKDYSKHSSKVEIDDKEWRKMRAQQDLIYNDAPSFMISSKHNNTTAVSLNSNNKKDERSFTKTPNKSPILAMKKRLFNKWPFASKSPSPHKNPSSREGTPSPSNLILQSSEYHSTSSDNDTYDRPPILGQTSVEGKKQSRPTRRSRSLYVVPSNRQTKPHPQPPAVSVPVVGVKKRRSSTNEADIAAVQRNSPLLGVGVGRDRRNIGKARNARKPTTRQVSSPASSTQPYNSTVSSITPEPVKKIISNPGRNDDKTKTKPKLRRRSSASAVVSSAALVEAAVRKRNSLTEMITDQGENERREREEKTRNDYDNTLTRRRKQPVTNPYAVTLMPEGATAQIVANAAASKARSKKEKSVEKQPHHKPPTAPLRHLSDRGGQNVTDKRVTKVTTARHNNLQPSHPLHKSRSFHSGEEIREEPIWVGLAKTKHKKNVQQYVSGDMLHKRVEGGIAVHQIKSYSDYLQQTKDKSSGKVTETKID